MAEIEPYSFKHTRDSSESEKCDNSALEDGSMKVFFKQSVRVFGFFFSLESNSLYMLKVHESKDKHRKCECPNVVYSGKLQNRKNVGVVSR